MSKIKVKGHDSGTGVITIEAPNTSTDRTITLPDSTGTLVDDTTAVTKDSSNNVGIGVTPESWNSGWNTLQIGDGASIAGRTASGNVDISSNAYRDSTDNRWEYIGANGSEEAAKYTQYDGQHVFYTAPSGSADAAITFSTKATIDSDGLKFNGDTASANALSDYETGTFTISLTGADFNFSGGNTTAHYTKIGRQVFYSWYSGATTISNTSGGAKIVNLPFTASNASEAFGLFSYQHGNALDGGCRGGYIQNNTTDSYFTDTDGTSTASFVNGSSKYLMIWGSYFTN